MADEIWEKNAKVKINSRDWKENFSYSYQFLFWTVVQDTDFYFLVSVHSHLFLIQVECLEPLDKWSQ